MTKDNLVRTLSKEKIPTNNPDQNPDNSILNFIKQINLYNNKKKETSYSNSTTLPTNTKNNLKNNDITSSTSQQEHTSFMLPELLLPASNNTSEPNTPTDISLPLVFVYSPDSSSPLSLYSAIDNTNNTSRLSNSTETSTPSIKTPDSSLLIPSNLVICSTPPESPKNEENKPSINAFTPLSFNKIPVSPVRSNSTSSLTSALKNTNNLPK